MPFPMKIKPVDHDPVAMKQPVPARWRFKRLFESKFPGVLRTVQQAERVVMVVPGGEKEKEVGLGLELEPSSVCLGKMVQNFLEESNEKTARCGRRRCNCFNGNCDDISDDDDDFFCGEPTPPASAQIEASESLKSLVLCTSMAERNLLADATRVVEVCRSKGGGKVDGKVFVERLVKVGYDAAVCKSRWEKTSAFPAGVYEYVDVIMDGGERLLVDVDFKSEFEMLRATKTYRSVLQILPAIFVGKTDRLQQIVAVVSEAAKQSMKKKGLHIPPWRKPEYMRSKWVSPFERFPPPPAKEEAGEEEKGGGKQEKGGGDLSSDGSLSLETTSDEKLPDEQLDQRLEKKSGELQVWQLPAVEPKAATPRGGKMVTGLLV